MIKKIIFSVFIFLIFSCSVDSLEKITGSWSYSLSATGYYKIDFLSESQFSLSCYEGDEEIFIETGKAELVNGELILFFNESNRFRSFSVESIGSKLTLINTDNPIEEMQFLKIDQKSEPIVETTEVPQEATE